MNASMARINILANKAEEIRKQIRVIELLDYPESMQDRLQNLEAELEDTVEKLRNEKF